MNCAVRYEMVMELVLKICPGSLPPWQRFTGMAQPGCPVLVLNWGGFLKSFFGHVVEFKEGGARGGC